MTASYMPHIVQICHHFVSPLPPAFAGPCNFNTVRQTCKHHTWFSSDAAGSEKTSLFCCNCGTFSSVLMFKMTLKTKEPKCLRQEEAQRI